MPDMPTGQLIRLYCIGRKKTTVNIATHAGITVRYLEMIEAGTKRVHTSGSSYLS